MINLLAKYYLHLALITIVGLLAYAGTFRVPFHYDDFLDIVNNPNIKDFKFILHPSQAISIGSNDYFRLYFSRIAGFATFAINYKIHGLSTTGYHVFNFFIHLFNAFFVYILFLFTFKTPFLKNNENTDKICMAALFAALVFVSHPIQTQSVTYIKQRFASLATFFYLATLISYIKFKFSTTSKHKTMWYSGALSSAVLAMMVKEISFTLPFILLIYTMLFFDTAKKNTIYTLAPFFLTLLIIPITLMTHVNIIDNANSATRIHSSLSRTDYLLTQFRVIITYIRLIFIPINQNLDYDYPLYFSFLSSSVLLSFVIHISLITIAIYWYFYSKTKMPVLRITAFGILWFYVTLAVESSLIPISDVISENRLYLASIGIFLAVTSAAYIIINILKTRYPNLTLYTLVVCVILISVLIFVTFKRNAVWNDPITLWEDVARKSPNKARVLAQLGTQYSDAGMYNKASALLQKAVSMAPQNYNYQINLGIVYYRVNMDAAALDLFKNALKIEPENDMIYDCIGAVYYRRGMLKDAINSFEKALKYNPHNTLAREHHSLAIKKSVKEQSVKSHIQPAE